MRLLEADKYKHTYIYIYVRVGIYTQNNELDVDKIKNNKNNALYKVGEIVSRQYI